MFICNQKLLPASPCLFHSTLDGVEVSLSGQVPFSRISSSSSLLHHFIPDALFALVLMYPVSSSAGALAFSFPQVICRACFPLPSVLVFAQVTLLCKIAVPRRVVTPLCPSPFPLIAFVTICSTVNTPLTIYALTLLTRTQASGGAGELIFSSLLYVSDAKSHAQHSRIANGFCINNFIKMS